MDDSIWDIFAEPAPPSATSMRDWVQTQTEPTSLASPAAPFRQTQSGVIRLTTRDLDQWMDLSKAKLQVRFRVACSNGDALASATAATLANGGFGLFENMTIYANGKEIDRIDNCHKVHLMNGYMSYSNAYLEQSAEHEWFYRPQSTLSQGNLLGVNDTAAGSRRFAGFANAVNPETGAQAYANANAKAIFDGFNAKGNPSFRTRFSKTQNSKEVELWLPLSAVSGFCRDVKKAIRGITLQVELNRNTDFKTIIHAQAQLLNTVLLEGLAPPAPPQDDYIALVNYVSLWIPVVRPTIEMASRIETQLAEGARTQWLYTNSKVYTSDEYNQTTPRWLVVSEASRPLLCVVGFQHSSQYTSFVDRANLAYNDAAATNNALPLETQPRVIQRPQLATSAPDLFSPLANITKVEVRINGYIVPTESYQVDFLNDNYKRAYQDFLSVYHKDEPDMSAKVFDEYVYRDSPLFAFDLRAYGDTKIYDQITTHNIEIRAQVQTSANGALADGLYGSGAYKIICMLVTEKSAQIEARSGRLSIMP